MGPAMSTWTRDTCLPVLSLPASSPPPHFHRYYSAVTTRPSVVCPSSQWGVGLQRSRPATRLPFLANVPPYCRPPFRHVCFICINNNIANNAPGCLHPMPLSEHFICNKIFSNYKIYLFINGVRQHAFANGSQHGCHTIFHHFICNKFVYYYHVLCNYFMYFNYLIINYLFN